MVVRRRVDDSTCPYTRCNLGLSVYYVLSLSTGTAAIGHFRAAMQLAYNRRISKFSMIMAVNAVYGDISRNHVGNSRASCPEWGERDGMYTLFNINHGM